MNPSRNSFEVPKRRRPPHSKTLRAAMCGQSSSSAEGCGGQEVSQGAFYGAAEKNPKSKFQIRKGVFEDENEHEDEEDWETKRFDFIGFQMVHWHNMRRST